MQEKKNIHHQPRTMSATTNATTHYDVLGVPRNADQAAIRKGYLRASLKYHPDKNPGNEAAAKAKFVEIGEAYSVLGDAAKRAEYDRELSSGNKFRFRPQQQQQQQQQQSRPPTQSAYSSASSTGGGFSSAQQQKQSTSTAEEDEAFQKFANMFDETVNGMSEAELNMAMGAAAAVGSIIGSIVASRAASSKGVNNSFLQSAASMVGSAIASRAASSLVQTVHEDSKQRMLEREDRAAAIARGERVQEPSAKESKERVFSDAGRAFKTVAGAAVAGSSSSRNVRVNNMSFGGNKHNGATSNGNRDGGNNNNEANGVQFNWGQAAKLAAMAVGACAEMQQGSGKSKGNR